MPKATKQADRNAAKKAGKREDEEPAAASAGGGDLLDRAKTLFERSCMMQMAPKIQDLLQGVETAKPNGAEKKETEEKQTEEKEAEEKESEDKENKETNGNHKDDDGDSATKMFNSLCARLAWSNVLGLAEPASGEDAIKAWISLKGLELDFGPRPKRNQSPGFDRIKLNVRNNLPQYLHALLALMMLRAFLFRSWFACLPWLVGYQVLSVMIPLNGIPQFPQVPVEKVEPKFRVVGTIAIHGLVWLFFLYETLWCTYFFEKIPLVGLFVYHAYAVRPLDR